jgi:SAM-dependent methyltransferase
VSAYETSEAILAAVERYYDDAFAAHGASPKGVDWNSAESQLERFEQLAKLFEANGGSFTVNDLGCGYGAFASFLLDRGFPASYTGYELSSAMLDHARAHFRDRPDVRFRAGTDLDAADYSVASGIFNVKLDFTEREWTAYVDRTIARLAEGSRKGFAFNMLTSYSDADRRRSDLYYADPRELFDLCKTRYARDVALLHDYGLWEFTIVVRLPQSSA